VSWLKSARPARIDSTSFAFRCFGGSLLTGSIVLGVIGLIAPSTLGIPGARPLGNRTASLAVGAVLLVSLAILAARRAHLIWLLQRIREPYIRPLTEDPHFEPAADALAQCSDTWQSRWATAWIFLPGSLAAVGVLFAFSSAYFVIDAAATLARVGWEQPVLAGVNAVLSIVCFGLGARRLSTWRLALSVHREVGGRYLE
jgi:hypothetical protein